MKVVKGGERVGVYNRSERSYRSWCLTCGGHLFTRHPTWGLTDVYAATLPTLRFEPRLHVNYQEHVLRIADGLPRMKDVPAEMGGSGQVLQE